MKPLILAARAALQWRLLLLWLVCLLLPAVLLSLPVWDKLGMLDHTADAAALARSLDFVAVADIAEGFSRDTAALETAGIAAVVLTLLLSPWLTGAVVAASRAPAPLKLRELFAAAADQYPRMFRMLLWGAVPLGLMGALGGQLGEAAGKHAEKVVLYADAHPWQLAASVAAVVLVLFANLTLDTGRAALAIDRRRTSAVKAWWRGLRLLWRRPGGVLLAWVAPTLLGALVAALLGLARLQVPALDIGGTVGAVLLAQLIVLALAWMRMTRLFALVALAQRDAGPAHLH